MIASDPNIVVVDRDGARTITISRAAKKNALTAAMYASMADAMVRAEDDPRIRAIVFASDGDIFTAGNDIADFLGAPPTSFDSPVFAFMRALARATLPIVVRVTGAAIGIGTTMLLHCDVVYATPNARFALPFVDLGLVPEAGSSVLLPRAIGAMRANEMILLGRPMLAPEAERLGLITRVVELADLDALVAETVAALVRKPLEALRASKRLLRGDPAEMEAIMRAEADVFGERLVSAEARAIFETFLKRS